MSKEKLKELITVSAILIGGGLLLLFLSYYWGISFAELVLESTSSGVVDYDLLVNTLVRSFIIMGSILFGSGVLMGVLTYLHFVLNGKKVYTTNNETGTTEVNQ